MKKHGWKSESEMAAAVVAWLKADGWTVYQEVEGPGGVADIVSTKGTLTWVIECKLALSLYVLEQAYRWFPYSFHVSVAVPHYTYNSPAGYDFGLSVASKFDIGVLTASPRFGVKVRKGANRQGEWNHENCFRLMSKYLHKEQQTFAAAGSPTGKRWTPFKGTVQSFTAYVKAHPGCTLKEVCTNAKHHWRKTQNAIASMRHLVIDVNPKKPPFPEIEAKYDPALRAYKLYPVAG